MINQRCDNFFPSSRNTQILKCIVFNSREVTLTEFSYFPFKAVIFIYLFFHDT